MGENRNTLPYDKEEPQAEIFFFLNQKQTKKIFFS
jgi:hypothetical protein